MKVRTAQWWDPRTWLTFMVWQWRTIFAAIYNDGWSDWKATVVVASFEFLAIVGLTNAVSVYFSWRLTDKLRSFDFLVGFAIALVNTPALLGKHKRLDRLSKEFESYSAPIRIAGGIAAFVLVCAAVFVAARFGGAQRLLPR